MEKEKDSHNVAYPSSATFTAEELLEAAKKSLQVEFREDGPPLGFEFDPIPTERRLSVEERAKAKRMVMGEYHGQPLVDNGIQVPSPLFCCFSKLLLGHKEGSTRTPQAIPHRSAGSLQPDRPENQRLGGDGRTSLM